MYVRAATYAISGVLLCSRYKKQFDFFLQRLYDAILYAMSPRFYVFFDEYSIPFPAHSVNLDATLSAKPNLVYNVEMSVFFPYLPNVSFADMLTKYKSNTLPILSLEIIDKNGTAVRDLTEFIENIRYIYVENHFAPTVSDIIAAWSVSNAIPIDRTLFRVRYITLEGDEVDSSLMDASELAEEPVTTDVNKQD